MVIYFINTERKYNELIVVEIIRLLSQLCFCGRLNFILHQKHQFTVINLNGVSAQLNINNNHTYRYSSRVKNLMLDN